MITVENNVDNYSQLNNFNNIIGKNNIKYSNHNELNGVAAFNNIIYKQIIDNYPSYEKKFS
mgnify:CR=1 FL=1